jgi:hypothetical protein
VGGGQVKLKRQPVWACVRLFCPWSFPEARRSELGLAGKETVGLVGDSPWTGCAVGLFAFGLKGTKNPRPSTRRFFIEKVGRGHAETAPHHNREPGVFVIALQEVFSFSEDWHQDDRAKPLVRQYEATLEGVLRDNPDLNHYVVQCCHCGLRFLTDPGNARRRDLRCPFGCREHQRRRLANERSVRYYRTAHGRKSKKLLNGRRSIPSSAGNSDASHDDLSGAGCDDSPGPDPGSSERQHESAGASETRVELQLEGLVLDEASVVNSPVLPYVRMVASLIEGRRIGLDELVGALRKTMRQRSMDLGRSRGNILHHENQRPP